MTGITTTNATVTATADPERSHGADGRRTVAAILALSAAIRLVLWTIGGDAPLDVHDERDYKSIALNLVERGEFSMVPGIPVSIRPPLYPAFVAGIYRVAGVGNDRAVRLVQAALGLILAWLTYRLASMLQGPRVATWATALVAFYPSLLVYQNLLLTEMLFTTLLVATCTALAGAYRRGSAAMLAVAGMLLGLSSLTRSVLWMYPPVLAAYLLATWPGPAARRIGAALAACIGFAVTLGPWALRNTILQRTFTAVDVMGGRNFMIGNYAYTPNNRAWAAIELPGERSWIGVLHARHSAEMAAGPTQGQIDKIAMREAVEYIRAHPGLTLRRASVKFFNFWGLERELVAGAAGRISAPALLALTTAVFGSYAAVAIAALFGTLATRSKDRRARGLILLIIIWVCGLHSLSFGHSRYHLPLVPLLAVFAAAAVVRRREIWDARRGAGFRTAAAAAVLLAASWVAEIVVVDFDRFIEALRLGA